MEKDEADHILLKPNMSVPEKSSKRSSSSSSSCYSSGEDFIQFDAAELGGSNTGNGHVHGSNSEPTHVGEEAQLASDLRTKGSEMAGTHPLICVFEGEIKVGETGESSLLGVEQSPTSQVYVREGVPDLNRIPSSIFERSKSTTPVEWSVASNESLFSISGGNSSFSRDHVFLLDKSGELPYFSNTPPLAYLPPMPAASVPDRMSLDEAQGLEQSVTAEAANAEAMKEVLRAAADTKGMPSIRGIQHSDSASRQSDASNQSFAFPILTQGRSVSTKVEPHHQFQAPTPQQLKPEEQNSQTDKQAAAAPPELTAGSPQTRCFSCCSCWTCF